MSDEEKDTFARDEQNGSASLLEEEDVRIKRAQYMLAVQWSSEIVAEKCAILGGAIVALNSFGLELAAVVGLAAIFFATEIVTDVIFVFVAEYRFNIPLLRLKFSHIRSRENIIILVMTATCLTSIAFCVEMAFMVPV